MDLSSIDARALVNAIPFPAMLIDSQHRVLDANTWMVRDEDHRHACIVACYELVHDTDAPITDCPLDLATVSGHPEVRTVSDDRNGRVTVTVTPLAFRSDRGLPVFLHVIESAM